MMKRYAPILLMILTSCQQVIDVSVPYGGDKVVTNAIQYSDSTWSVNLTLTKYILSAPQQDFLPVTDAKVVIRNPNGASEQLTFLGNGKYGSPSYPQPGITYRIIVTAEALEPSEGEMTMPTLVPMVDIEWDSTGVRQNGPPGYYFSDVPFKVTFNDPAGVTNYYSMEVYGYYAETRRPPGRAIIQDTVIQPLSVYIKDAAIATQDDFRHRFNDKTFEGKTYTAPFITYLSEYEDHDLYMVEVRLVNISEALFRYEETMELNDDVEGDPFAQPVQIFSNMSNGFGIFAGAAFDSRRYKTN
jgi:hypothetical protein